MKKQNKTKKPDTSSARMKSLEATKSDWGREGGKDK